MVRIAKAKTLIYIIIKLSIINYIILRMDAHANTQNSVSSFYIILFLNNLNYYKYYTVFINILSYRNSIFLIKRYTIFPCI